ncbi:hypothetical protein [Paenibacillus taiwanensis]
MCYGQIGNVTKVERLKPVQISSLSGIKEVSGGY